MNRIRTNRARSLCCLLFYSYVHVHSQPSSDHDALRIGIGIGLGASTRSGSGPASSSGASSVWTEEMCEYDRQASNLVRQLFQRIDQFLFGEAERSPVPTSAAASSAAGGGGSVSGVGSLSSSSGRPAARPTRTPLRSLSTFNSQNASIAASRWPFITSVIKENNLL